LRRQDAAEQLSEPMLARKLGEFAERMIPRPSSAQSATPSNGHAPISRFVNPNIRQLRAAE
jgi:hypothetical protein